MTAKTAAKDEPNFMKEYEIALELLDRAAKRLSDDHAPDPQWWKDYFLLTGLHMVLTDEGWQPGDVKQICIDNEESILDEVNAPEAIHG